MVRSEIDRLRGREGASGWGGGGVGKRERGDEVGRRRGERRERRGGRAEGGA